MRSFVLRVAAIAAAVCLTASAAQAQEKNICGHTRWKDCPQLSVVNTMAERWLWVTVYFQGTIKQNSCVPPHKTATVNIDRALNENSTWKLRGEMVAGLNCRGDRKCDTDISGIQSGGRYEIRPTKGKEEYDCYWQPVKL